MYYMFVAMVGALSGVLLTVMGLKIMQILQLSSYRARGIFSWLKSTKYDYLIRYFSVAFFSFVPMAVFVGCFGRYQYVKYIGVVFYAAMTLLFVFITSRTRQKTPLRYTPRIVRLVVLTWLITSAASFGLVLLGDLTPLSYAFIGIMPILTPFSVIAAHYILLPFEMLNNLGYERKAHKKLLEKPALVKIGITGSYGKTTAKNILAAMLSKKYDVLATPASYNTPMGIARAVNGDLEGKHRVFIAEMGARYRGDVAHLCKLVCPDMGIITAVGNQHLATFGDVATVAATKYELIENLSPSGLAVFSSDNDITAEMYEKTANCEKRLAGKSGQVTYGDVSYGENGTSFTLTHGSESTQITTVLLGAHIPSLVAVCAVVALELGVTLGEIATAVGELEQVPHRLQLIKNGDVTVLDDAYNSNPVGARNALDVLSAFDGTRMVITPGLVELGDEEQKANREIGEKVPACADYAYFVGARAQWLKSGAISGGMPEDKVFVCATLDEAVKLTEQVTGKKTILFENDLPDNL